MIPYPVYQKTGVSIAGNRKTTTAQCHHHWLHFSFDWATLDLSFLCCLLQKYVLQRDNKIENFCSFRYFPGVSTGQYKRFDRAEVGKGSNINLQANLGGTPSPVRYEQNQKVALAVFRQGPRFSIRMVIGIFCSDTVFVQLNQYSQILRRQCCLLLTVFLSSSVVITWK